MVEKPFRVRPLTFSDLARLYKLCRHTIRKRAMQLGLTKMIGNFLNVAQIWQFVERYGWPQVPADQA